MWNYHGKKPVSLTLANYNQERYQQEYENVNHGVPFQIHFTDQKDKRNKHEPFFDTEIFYNKKHNTFDIEEPLYEKDVLRYIPPGDEMRQMRIPPFVVYENHKTVFFIPLDSTVLIMNEKDIVCFPPHDVVFKNVIPVPHKLLVIPVGRTVAEAEEVKEMIGKHGEDTQFYRIPKGASAFVVSDKRIKNWRCTL